MSQTFYDVFDPNEIVQDTMEQLLEDSLDALRTSFEGTSDPASPKPSQFCSNTTDGKLKVRAQDGLGWDDLYDFTNQEPVLTAGQVDAVHISDTARKGTIVEGENIDPNSCTIQAKFKTVSLPALPCEVFPIFTNPAASIGVGVLLLPTAWETLLTSKVYVPEDAGTLYAMFYQVTCEVQFTVEAQTSSSTGIEVGPGWGSVVSIDTSSISGWQDIEVQGKSSVPVTPFGGIGGIAFRWEN